MSDLAWLDAMAADGWYVDLYGPGVTGTCWAEVRKPVGAPIYAYGATLAGAVVALRAKVEAREEAA